MADSASFEFACGELESATSLERLEARGTVRLALKEAGLEARTVAPHQLVAVLTKVLPQELTNRGVEDAEGICRTIAAGVSELPDEGAGNTPEAVFRRLGGGD
jgi:hypothetical protein